MGSAKEEKPFIFNKAKYRQKKYSHAHKLGDWKKNHKLEAQRKYKKLLRKEEKKKNVSQKSNANLEPMGVKPRPMGREAMSGLQKARKVYDAQLEAKKKVADEAKSKQAEKEAAVKKYKEKKAM